MSNSTIVIGTLATALAVTSVALHHKNRVIALQRLQKEKLTQLVMFYSGKLDEFEVPLTEFDEIIVNDISTF